MKRHILDLLFRVGGVGPAGLLLIIGIVMYSNANSSNKHVTGFVHAFFPPRSEAFATPAPDQAAPLARAAVR